MNTEDQVDDVDPQRAERVELIAQWENLRDSRLLIIGTHTSAQIQVGECSRHAYEHLRELPQRPTEKIDLLIVGRGLTTPVASRVVSLIREYTRELNIALTGIAGPGETLASLAADSIVMHPLAGMTTVLDRRPESFPEDGLNSLVSQMLESGEYSASAIEAAQRGVDPADVGSAIHRLQWAREQIHFLCNSRLNPPSGEDIGEIRRALTQRNQRPYEQIPRKHAREIKGLVVHAMQPELEKLSFELHTLYERLLHLLQPPSSTSPLALIESSSMLHLLLPTSDGAQQWRGQYDTAVH